MNRKRRRSFRSNPDSRGLTIFGLTLPPWDAVLFVGAGLAVPPLLTTQVFKLVPDSWKVKDEKTGALMIPGWLMWTVRAAAVIIPGMAIRRFVNPRAGNLYMVGGVASMVLEVVRPWLGLGYQPMLGAYFTRPAGGRVLPYPQQTRALGPSAAGVPERLNPANRY